MKVKLEKIWGTTEPLILTPLFEMHRLIIKPGHRCSLHVHQTKHNAFYVIEGELEIFYKYDLHKSFVVTLRAGDNTTVHPGIIHEFRTGDVGCTVLEMYYTEPLGEDIQRFNVGGPVNAT